VPVRKPRWVGSDVLRRSVLVLTLGTCAVMTVPATSASARSIPSKRLFGTFKLDPGICTGLTVSGSYFRMTFPTQPSRLFFNSGSSCSNQSYTLLAPGTAGGLRTGQYQPSPTPAFSSSGNALANLIVQPQRLGSNTFSVATPARDPRTGRPLPTPQITENRGRLSGQLEAWSIALAGGSFDQGTPRPGPPGGRPRSTALGTYNPSTKAFVLSWSSTFVGGPFNGFTGNWHLQGTFVPAPNVTGKA